jgi:integrase
VTGSRRGGKRGNGEGTVYQRADGRWEGAAVVPVAGGGRARRRVYGRTRQETSAKLTALLRQAEQGIAAPVAGQTVAGYLAGWLADTAKRHLRPRTYETYELLSRRHIVPLVGAKRLDRLTAADIRRLLNAKSDEGLSASTVRQLHAVLRVALQQAVRDDLLPRNVAQLVQVPVACPDPVQPLDLDDARQLLETARGGRLYALWAVAIGVGLRRGEALALRWSDVDLDGGTLRVEQSVQRVDGKLRFAPPKTARSRRTIPLPSVCVAALRAHWAAQNAERLGAGLAWHDFGLVFTTSIGTPIEPRNLNRSFDALCARAGIRRLRVHDLRHTCASLLLAQGVAPRVVMEILGHSQIAVTMNIYSHVLPAVEREAADRMNAALSGDVAVTVAVNGSTPAAPDE